MALTIILLIVGMILIIKGGDFFVDAASWMAEKTGIPKLIVGATIVSLATTLPEIIVSLIAAAQGSVDMAIGNAVGSVTANLGLIMGIAMLFLPGKINPRDYRGKFILMLLSAILVVIGGATGGVTLPMAVILLVLVAVFFWDNLRIARSASKKSRGSNGSSKSKAQRLSSSSKSTKSKSLKSTQSHKSTSASKASKSTSSTKAAKVSKKSSAKLSSRPLREKVWWNLVKFVLGAAGIVGGAQLLVQSGTDLATAIGVSERIISVTIIAIGTSLPELVTTITAIIKKENALSYGNILGANIIDLSLIMPLCAIISGQTLTISATSAAIDLPACLIIAAIAIIPTTITKRFSRWQGVIMLAVYVAYVVITCLQ